MWHSRQASMTTFPLFPYSRKVMIVLRRALYCVVSDGHGFGLFVPLPPAVLIGFTQESNILWEAALAKLCFSVLFSSCFTHSTKAPLFLFHLPLGRCDHKGFIHTLCFFILSAGSFPGPATNVQSGSPVQMLILIGGVFLDALLYYQ